MVVVSPGSNIARQLPDLCPCVPYPWGQIPCRHNSNSSVFGLRSSIKIYHHCLCLCYMLTQVGHLVLLNASMSTKCSILHISALQLLARQSVSFCTDFTIHKLSSLLYTSQVYFFKYCSKSFCPLELKGVLTNNKSTWHTRTPTHSLLSALRMWNWGFNKGVPLIPSWQ